MLRLAVSQCLGVECSDVCWCWTVTVLSLEFALSDEKAGQSFVSSSNYCISCKEYKKSVCTSQETHNVTPTESSQLMLLKETATVRYIA
jgi:hypothetical protein